MLDREFSKYFLKMAQFLIALCLAVPFLKVSDIYDMERALLSQPKKEIVEPTSQGAFKGLGKGFICNFARYLDTPSLLKLSATSKAFLWIRDDLHLLKRRLYGLSKEEERFIKRLQGE